MEKLTIIIDFKNAQRETPIWAESEREVDFRRDSFKANRCTVAFAAMELKHFLARTFPNLQILFDEKVPANEFSIQLKIQNLSAKPGSFVLEPVKNGLLIQGQDRAGVLYGVYEFLRLQGWDWFAPGKAGEVVPPARTELNLPKQKIKNIPSLELRSLHMTGISKESTEFLNWMARNRLNCYGWRAFTGQFGRKLGMIPRAGGHIFEKILDHDRVLPDGTTLWESHRLWYGLPQSGKREKETALRTQFCVSQPDLLQFLGKELCNVLMTDWYELDLVNIWGFDTWGSTCQCSDCQELGNSTDQMLHLLSGLRKQLDLMRQSGDLDHPVRLAGCAYEGTATMLGPSRSVPENLLEANDMCIFYPINRCYAHNLADPACSKNQFYFRALQSWSGKIPIMIGEYYNVSKFQDLPLLFSERLRHDQPTYHSAAINGMSYMHVPMVTWGVRTQTQLLHAQLAWNKDTNFDQFVNRYFEHWYEVYADEMREIYALVESAWRYISQWRAWDHDSILSRLLEWDGRPPAHSLNHGDHFQSISEVIESGRESVLKMENALDQLTNIRQREKLRSARTAKMTKVGFNPEEAKKHEQQYFLLKRLGEDFRGLIYGRDTMSLMSELLAYHTALQKQNQPEAEACWKRVEIAEEALFSYYVPLDYEHPGAGIAIKDGLTRAQLGPVINRCRKYRLER